MRTRKHLYPSTEKAKGLPGTHTLAHTLYGVCIAYICAQLEINFNSPRSQQRHSSARPLVRVQQSGLNDFNHFPWHPELHHSKHTTTTTTTTITTTAVVTGVKWPVRGPAKVLAGWFMLRCGNNNKSTTSDGDGDVREKVQTETKYRWKALKDLFIKWPPCGRIGGGGAPRGWWWWAATTAANLEMKKKTRNLRRWRKIYFEADLTCSQAN